MHWSGGNNVLCNVTSIKYLHCANLPRFDRVLGSIGHFCPRSLIWVRKRKDNRVIFLVHLYIPTRNAASTVNAAWQSLSPLPRNLSVMDTIYFSCYVFPELQVDAEGVERLLFR
jgi:hypothetical protein